MTSHGINMADQKFAQEVPKMATLEGYKIGLNWPISILFVVNKSGRKALLIKLKNEGRKIRRSSTLSKDDYIFLTCQQMMTASFWTQESPLNWSL